MNYINQIDENLVKEIVGKFLFNIWHSDKYIIKKQPNSFKIVYKLGNNYYSLIVKDFDIDFGSKHMWCTALNKKWQIAMAKKFGSKYLDDLHSYMLKNINKKNKSEKQKIDCYFLEINKELNKQAILIK